MSFASALPRSTSDSWTSGTRWSDWCRSPTSCAIRRSGRARLDDLVVRAVRRRHVEAAVRSLLGGPQPAERVVELRGDLHAAEDTEVGEVQEAQAHVLQGGDGQCALPLLPLRADEEGD